MPNTKGSATPPLPDDEAIAKRAYELYLQRGSLPGFELDDWLQAEAELIARTSTNRASAPARTARPPATPETPQNARRH
jgi:hypothetical protein